jgi:2-keto-3-deoxy-L-rhamnonate aldolase RhmA
MLAVRNHAKERLEAGELALGVGLRQARTVDIAKIMKTAGYDFLFIDMEHNSMSIDLAAQISIAAQDAGITPVVRVPDFQHFHATRALDGGAQGCRTSTRPRSRPGWSATASIRRSAIARSPAPCRSWTSGRRRWARPRQRSTRRRS